MKEPRIYSMSFGDIYPMYVAKAEKKGRSQAEVDQIIAWLTGYQGNALTAVIDDGTTMKQFFDRAPALNPKRTLVTGKVCGVRVEELEASTMREIRYLDKLIDELARGKALNQILR